MGSIYGIWRGSTLLNKTGRSQVASAMAAYGPRTSIMIAIPSSSTGGKNDRVVEVTLTGEGKIWTLSRDDVKIKRTGKTFAPGNLRAGNDNTSYGKLIQYWIAARYTLRYSGAMVPDVWHILAKGGGVFSNVSSIKAKAKLRLLYEVAPIGLIVECAGGTAIHESCDVSVLDVKIDDLDKRLGVCFGSTNEVKIYAGYMSTTISTS